ncbi:MAG TPA: HDOD domain-containing protein [Verrucomicrobiae bacterium]|nr:HDOD domain-containing protein [Verrucomicrobiae bacterium]
MSTDVAGAATPCEPLDRKQIETRLNGCPSLPSLSSINNALKGLLGADQRFTFQIAEIIRRDPSLTARLLRLVNSVYYGISRPIKNIEEAVFYLGVRQIRELAMVTPIIEDMQKLAGHPKFAWREFWRHCIGTAILTREIMEIVEPSNDDTFYLGGLLHDMGKIVMAATFPKHFAAIYLVKLEPNGDLLQIEKNVLGMDHTELGAIYLKKQMLTEVFVDIAQFHHQPELSANHRKTVSAVQIANLLIRKAKIGDSGDPGISEPESWMESSGWKTLFARQTEAEQAIVRASLKRSLERIPVILEGLI